MSLPRRIQDAITNNKLVVFAGSGLSARFNLPSWTKLVEDVISEIDKEQYKTLLPVLKSGLLTPIEVLEILKPEHNTVRRYIRDHFKITEGNFDLHKDMLQLTNQIITTNYDNAFEEASGNSIIPTNYISKLNVSELNKSDEPYIFKLHGSYSESDNCIIFKSDYENLYSDDTAAKQKLKSIFTDKTLLFIGFSFNDPDINTLFNHLDLLFGNNNKHFILTKPETSFDKYVFLEKITFNEYNEIDKFIKECVTYKAANKASSGVITTSSEKIIPKIVLLFPNPIDLNLAEDLDSISDCFDTLEINLYVGTLNIKTLENLDDFDLILIASKVFKSNLYIEDDNLKSKLLSTSEICSHIPNVKIPVVFITNEKIDPVTNHPTINISTFRRPLIKRFAFKALREGRLDFYEDEQVFIHLSASLKKILKGTAKILPLYSNNKSLEIGKKSLKNVIGRIEEQASIALKLISIIKTNKLLNIKASGGTGKTTIIKKVAYELYNRGYYKEGVTFKSCETIKTFADFEEIVISGFKLTNILNFKDYLIDNFNNNKIDLLIILDNFETVVNSLTKEEFKEVIELLKFATDYANIVVTSREKLSTSDDFEDVYSLTPLVTDDAAELFQIYYGPVVTDEEIKILRQDILEDLLNNNPLAIKLVTKSRVRSKHISELSKQLKEHFFESINEDYTLVFKNNADLNIERTKSIYQSINYSYTTLTHKEKTAFELLSLFPDGISLSNFKKCFSKKNSSNSISDKELRNLRDKSLVEDYNGNLQLQPIIRRFADYQFFKRPKDIKEKYCVDAYSFNCFVLDVIELVENKNTISHALNTYNLYKNNLLNVLSYIPNIELQANGPVPEKKFLLNYIYSLQFFIVNEKQITEYRNKLNLLQKFFSDLQNAETLIKVLYYYKTYFHEEFDNSYEQLSKLFSVEEMENRVYDDEDYIEKIYRDLISNVYSMEGYTVQKINSLIKNNDTSKYLDSHFFYLGIVNNIPRKTHHFYDFEYELMFKKLQVNQLEEYINSLHTEEHLEIMQSTYTLSKVKTIPRKTIQKLVVTNPYTKGLKELMFAFSSTNLHDKAKHFQEALTNLFHIKYFYLESLYYYSLFLKDNNSEEYLPKKEEGYILSKKFHYRYLNFLFDNIENPKKEGYKMEYTYYPLPGLEEYVKSYDIKWEKKFKENDIDEI